MFESKEDFDVEDDFLQEVFITKEKQKKILDIPNTVSKKPKLSHNSQKLVKLIESQSTSTTNNVSDDIFEDTLEFSSKNLQFKDLNKQTSSIVSSIFSNDSTCDIFEKLNEKETTPSKNEIVVQRKFPGPAGLVHLKNNLEKSSEKTKINNEEEIIVSQTIILANNEPTWIEMLKVYGTLPLNEHSIANAKNKAFTNKLLDQKLPFLTILIKHIDCISTDQKVLFYDSTGEISGILHEEVFKSFEAYLQKGSCLVLRNVPILGSGLFVQREYHITITLANIIKIYSYNDKKIKVINVNNISITQILNDIRNNQQKSLNSSSMNSPTSNKLKEKFSVFKNNSKLKERNENYPIQKLGTFPSIINGQRKNRESLNKTNEQKNNQKILPLLKHSEKLVSSSITNTSKNKNAHNSSNLSPFEQEITENLFDGLDASLIFDDF